MKYWLLICCLLLSVFSNAKSKKLTFATDPWCPYICDIDSNHPGILIEAIQEIYSTSDYDINFIRINWARSIKEVRRGEIDALIGTYKSDAPDFIFSNNAFLVSQMCFYVPIKDDWKFTGALSLNERKVAFMNAYSYGDLFDNYILDNEHHGERNLLRVNGVDKSARRLNLLNLKRVNTIIEDKYVVPYLLKQEQNSLKIKNVGCLNSEKVYVGFSPSLPYSKTHSETLNKGIVQLKASGKLDLIVNKYID